MLGQGASFYDAPRERGQETGEQEKVTEMVFASWAASGLFQSIQPAKLPYFRELRYEPQHFFPNASLSVL